MFQSSHIEITHLVSVAAWNKAEPLLQVMSITLCETAMRHSIMHQLLRCILANGNTPSGPSALSPVLRANEQLCAA